MLVKLHKNMVLTALANMAENKAAPYPEWKRDDIINMINHAHDGIVLCNEDEVRVLSKWL